MGVLMRKYLIRKCRAIKRAFLSSDRFVSSSLHSLGSAQSLFSPQLKPGNWRIASSYQSAVLIGAALSLTLSGCLVDTAQEQEGAVQGDYDDGNAEHRPGQPCLLCHGPDHFPRAPGEEIFILAGTVYSFVDDLEDDGLSGVDVEITDANERNVTVTTNQSGNFIVSEGGDRNRNGWLKISGTLEFPLEVRITRDGDERVMRTKILQEGSCARCHGESPDVDSVGRIFLYEEDEP